jgi:hypothetical protein
MLSDLKTDNPGTIDKLFNANENTYKTDDKGEGYVFFKSTGTQTKGDYVLKAGEKSGENLINALTKDDQK